MTKTRALVLIPARMAATRLPGKPLLDIGGLPMIVQVVRRAEAARIGRVVVATDSADIAGAVTGHGGEAVLTRAESDAMADCCESLIQERGWGFWAAESKGSGEFIGFVGLHIPSAQLPRRSPNRLAEACSSPHRVSCTFMAAWRVV